MTDLQFLINSGSEGATLTGGPGNTGAALVSFPGGTGEFRASVAGLFSDRGALLTNAANAQALVRFNFNSTNNQVRFSGVCTLPSVRDTAHDLIIGRFRAVTGFPLVLRWKTNGDIILVDAAGAAIGTFATAAALATAGITGGSKFRFTAVLTVATATTGVLHCKIRKLVGDTQVVTSDLTNVNLGTSPIQAWEGGVVSTNNAAGFGVGWTEVQMGDGAGSEYAALTVANVAPTADAGADFTVDPNLVDRFTIDGSASTDPDGVVASYGWTLPGGWVYADDDAGSGPVRSVAVPTNKAGTSGTVSLLIADNEGATDTDTVVVTVLPHDRWLCTAPGSPPTVRAIRRGA